MFTTKDKNMARASENSGVVNLIGVGTTILGDITSSGDIRVDGLKRINQHQRQGCCGVNRYRGRRCCMSKCRHFRRVKSKISVSELLALKSTAKLDGADIVTNKLAIEPGATFSGSCSMGAVIKDIKDAGKQEVQKQEKSA